MEFIKESDYASYLRGHDRVYVFCTYVHTEKQCASKYFNDHEHNSCFVIKTDWDQKAEERMYGWTI